MKQNEREEAKGGVCKFEEGRVGNMKEWKVEKRGYLAHVDLNSNLNIRSTPYHCLFLDNLFNLAEL